MRHGVVAGPMAGQSQQNRQTEAVVKDRSVPATLKAGFPDR